MKAASGVITWTGGSSSARTVSGLLDGATPTALLFLTWMRDTTWGVGMFSFGAATAVATQRAHSCYHSSDVAPFTGNRCIDTGVASFVDGLTPAAIALSALGGGTFTLTPGAAVPANGEGRTYWIALADVAADLRTLSLTSAGTVRQTTAFTPRAVLMGARCGTAAAMNSTQNGAMGALGLFTAQDAAAFGCNVYSNMATPSVSGTRASRTGLPKMDISAADAAGVQGVVTVPAWVANGYDVSINNVSSANEAVLAWALALDCDAALLPFTIPSAIGAQALTGAGRRGQAAIALLAPRVATADTRAHDLSLAAGFAVGGIQGLVRMHAPHNAATPLTAHTTATDAITGGQLGTGETSRAAFTSFDADGVTLTWSDADATAGLGAVLLLGDDAATPAADALAFASQPADTPVGATMPAFSVAAVDTGLDEVDTSFTGTITLADPTNDFLGTKARAAVAGVAVFNDIVPQKLGVDLTFDATAAGLTAAESAPFTVSAPAGTGVVLTGATMYHDTIEQNTEQATVELEAVSLVDGTPVTTLTHATVGLIIEGWRGANGVATPIDLAAQTPTGAWTAGGFCHRVNGRYRLDVPAAFVLEGVPRVRIEGRGVANVRIVGAVLDLTEGPPRAEPATDAEIARKVFRAMHYADGYGVRRVAGDATMELVEPDVAEPTDVAIDADAGRPPIVAAGAAVS